MIHRRPNLKGIPTPPHPATPAPLPFYKNPHPNATSVLETQCSHFEPIPDFLCQILTALEAFK